VRLFHKIAVVLVAAAAIPLGTVGFAVVSTNQRALESEVRARFDQTARHAAEAVAADVEGRARQLAQTAAMITWDKLDPDEARGALELLRRQAKAAAAALYDDAGKISVQSGDVALLGERAPRERARKEGAGAIVFSTPYSAPTGVTLAGAVAVRHGVVALAIPLEPQALRLVEVRGDQRVRVSLIDDSGKPIAASTPLGQAAQPASAAVVAEAVGGKDGHARRYLDKDQSVVAAFAPVGGLGWSVVVEDDTERAFAAPRRMRRLTLLVTGVAGLLAIGLAFAFARRLTAALERLSDAARAFGRGKLDERVELETADEVGALARTFNQMGGELQTSRAEIEKWNRELEARVEERTFELKAAQAQLVQAQKLAALGQLGAGVAHEINNPLGGVLGHVQLLLADRPSDDRDYEALQCIDEAARKASHVVQNLLRFSVQHKDPVRTPVDANKLVRDTLSLTQTLLAEQKIAIALLLDPSAPRCRADAGQIGQVLLNLVANARTAMANQGGALTVRTKKIEKGGGESEVAISVEDTGKGIDPAHRDRIFEPFFTTKDEWSNVGLGLSVSYRIISEHGGRIEVASEVGHGSTFTVYLPS